MNNEEEHRPISPVISRRPTRRFIKSKKSKQKSRVKLTDRFKADPLEDFTPSQTEDIFKSIEEIEQVEVEDTQHITETVQSTISKEQNGFCTGTGEIMVASQKKTNLFNDILNPSQENSGRDNKYSFLTRVGPCSTVLPLVQQSGPSIISGTKNRFGDEFSDLKIAKELLFSTDLNLESIPQTNSGVGFKTASGGGVQVSQAALKGAGGIFSKKFHRNSNKRLVEASVSKVDSETVRNFFSTDLESIPATKSEVGFKMRGANGFFSDELFQNCEKKPSVATISKSNHEGFAKASGGGITLSESATKGAQKMFGNELSLVDCNQKLSTATENGRNASNEMRANFEKEFGGELKDNIAEFVNKRVEAKTGFKGFSQEAIKEAFGIVKKLSSFICQLDRKPKRSLSGDDLPYPKKPKLTEHTLGTSKISQNTSRKTLGMSRPTPVKFSKEKLQKAEQLFDFSLPRTNSFSCSTPSKTVPAQGTSPLLTTALTPIKSTPKITASDREIVFTQPKEMNLAELEAKLDLLAKRVEILKFQRFSLQNKEPSLRRPRLGILARRKQEPQRSLRSVLKFRSDDPNTFDVTPNSAKMLHFKHEEASPSIKTIDGAVIIPNIDNLVGLSEIEAAFKVMPGVDPGLILPGWSKNHYKWIVWKLASYEKFCAKFDSLNVENVIQQLKYRYDREIGRAERPALRRIFEMDEPPQRRMVLCVSNILEVATGRFDLELTDGWYNIRTLIDDNLCQQILKGKIRIATKLVFAGAEILHCEACHPLNAPHTVRLKIHSNMTRRARWDAKLGFQKFHEPFPIKLSSICPNGGVIGRVTVYVARVYPVKYYEKQGNLTVWRNRKADERRAQEWENHRMRKVEELQDLIKKDYEKTRKSLNLSRSEISKISCPETLYECYQSDPEGVLEILTDEQKQTLSDHHIRFLSMQQYEESTKLKDDLEKSNLHERDVTSVLKLLVVDISPEGDEKGTVFQIWRPSGEHLDVIKEGAVFEVYNVLPRCNCDIRSTKNTKLLPKSCDISKFERLKRKCTPIASLYSADYKPIFDEFDVVAVVVNISIDNFGQELWLSDLNQRLLRCKVFEGPKNCSLFSNLKEGQIVAIQNLISCRKKSGFVETVANHTTSVLLRPKEEYLQKEMAEFEKSLLENRKGFLEQCRQKISSCNTDPSVLLKSTLLSADVFDDSWDLDDSTFIESVMSGVELGVSNTSAGNM